jgi:hypothetical protein
MSLDHQKKNKKTSKPSKPKQKKILIIEISSDINNFLDDSDGDQSSTYGERSDSANLSEISSLDGSFRAKRSRQASLDDKLIIKYGTCCSNTKKQQPNNNQSHHPSDKYNNYDNNNSNTRNVNQVNNANHNKNTNNFTPLQENHNDQVVVSKLYNNCNEEIKENKKKKKHSNHKANDNKGNGSYSSVENDEGPDFNFGDYY